MNKIYIGFLSCAAALATMFGLIAPKVSFAALASAPTVDSLKFSYMPNTLSGNGSCSGSMMYVNILDSQGNLYFNGNPTMPGGNTLCTNGSYSFILDFNNAHISPDFDLNNPEQLQMYNIVSGGSPEPGALPAEALFTRTKPSLDGLNSLVTKAGLGKNIQHKLLAEIRKISKKSGFGKKSFSSADILKRLGNLNERINRLQKNQKINSAQASTLLDYIQTLDQLVNSGNGI